jgi:hypothetical protein
MPQTSQKHDIQENITIPYPHGGMNSTTSPQRLPDTQAMLIENFYYDYSSGVLRTRWPFRRHSNSVVDSVPVNGIYYWNTELLFSAGGNLYYLDSSDDSQLIGTLNGTDPPSFLAFKNKLFIAAGGALQELNTSRALSDTSNAPSTATSLIEKNAQIGLVGDSANPDRYYECATMDETTWSGGTSEYYTLGYLDDDLKLIGVQDGPYGFCIFWKRGTSNQSTWWLNPNMADVTDVRAIRVSQKETSFTHRSNAWISNKLWFADQYSLMALGGVDDTENMMIDPQSLEVGSRIARDWVVDSNAFFIVYPPHSQLWIFPRVADSWWVLDYRTNSIVKFKAAEGLKFYSGYYQPGEDLWLGGNDGYIYKMDTTGTGDFQDETGGSNNNYIQKYYSKAYEPFPMDEHIVKRFILDYNGLKAGSGTLSILSGYGSNQIEDDHSNVSITYVSSYPTLVEYADETLVDHADEYLWVSQMRSVDIKKHTPGIDNAQIRLEITSGAIEIRGVNMTIARGRKEP